MFVVVTVRSHDALNGRRLHIHPDDIRLVMPEEKVYKDKTPLIGEEPELITVINFANGRVQGVVESVDDIYKQMDAAYQARAWAGAHPAYERA